MSRLSVATTPSLSVFRAVGIVLPTELWNHLLLLFVVVIENISQTVLRNTAEIDTVVVGSSSPSPNVVSLSKFVCSILT